MATLTIKNIPDPLVSRSSSRRLRIDGASILKSSPAWSR